MMSCDTYFEKMRAYQPTSLAIRAQLWTNHDDQINTNEYNETESVRDHRRFVCRRAAYDKERRYVNLRFLAHLRPGFLVVGKMERTMKKPVWYSQSPSSILCQIIPPH